jgi:hypothetical protein
MLRVVASGTPRPSNRRRTGASRGEARFVEQPLEQNAHGVFGSADVAAEGGGGGHGVSCSGVYSWRAGSAAGVEPAA